MFKLAFLALAVLAALAGGEPATAGEFHRAIEAGDQARVAQMLAADPQLLTAPDDDGDRSLPLNVAARFGRAAVARLLLDAGADVEGGDKDDSTALQLAVMLRQADVVDLLLSRGANVNRRDRNGAYALSRAVNSGDAALVERVLRAGADRHYLAADGSTLLHAVARGGNVDLVKRLIALGADVNIADRRARTPLWWATQANRAPAVDALLAAGASAAGKDDMGETPLGLAARNGDREIVAALLKGGAEPNGVETNYGRSPLHWASAQGFEEVVNQLLQAGASVAQTDNAADTPLALAARHGHRGVVERLTARGARPAAATDGERLDLDTPLAEGEAIVWYLEHSGWAVKTKSRLLIFDYFRGQYPPDQPALSNGTVVPAEIAGREVVAFVSHEHTDHCDTTIFTWRQSVPKITYVLGCDVPRAPAHVRMLPHQERTIAGVKVRTIQASDAGVGYLVEVDGVRIFHAGDHANTARTITAQYKGEIDDIAAGGGAPDIVLLPVSGCRFGDPEAVRIGVEYALDKLHPRTFFPMHAGRAENRLADFVKTCAPKFPAVAMGVPRDRGDRFLYRGGKLASSSSPVVAAASAGDGAACTGASRTAASCAGR